LVKLSAEAPREESGAAGVVGESSVVLRDALVDERVVQAVGAQVLAGDGVGAGRELLAGQTQDVALGDSSGVAADVVGANAADANAAREAADANAARKPAYPDRTDTAVNGADAAVNIAREAAMNAAREAAMNAAREAAMNTAMNAADAAMDATNAAVRDATKAATDAADEALVSLLLLIALRRSEGRGGQG